jgi:hypothetical protein
LKVTKPKKNGKAVRREWTKADVKELKAHSRARTPVTKISPSPMGGGSIKLMFQLGQKRRFASLPMTSGLPR